MKEKYLPLVAAIVATQMRTAGRYVDYRYMEAEALYGLVMAKVRFKSGHKTRPSTWAYKRIQGACLDVVRGSYFRSQRYTAIDPTDSFADTRQDPEAVLVKKQALAKVLQVMYRCLPRDQVHVMMRCYLHGRNDLQLAKEMGLTPAKVSQLKSQAIQRIKQLIPAGVY